MKLKLLLPTLLTLLCFFGVKAQGPVTYEVSAQGYSNAEKITKWEDPSVVFTFDDNGGTSPAYYNTGTAVRLYGKNSLLIEAQKGLKINKIEFYTPASGSNAMVAGNNSPNTSSDPEASSSESSNGTSTWIYNDGVSSVKFTNKNSSGHIRIQKIIIYFVQNTDTRQEPNLKWTYPQSETVIDNVTVNIDDNLSEIILPTLSHADGLPTDKILYSYLPDNNSIVEFNDGGAISSLKKKGTVTVTASFPEEDTSFKSGEASYTIVVEGRDPNLSLSETGPFTIQNNEVAWTPPTIINPNGIQNLKVTWSTENVDIVNYNTTSKKFTLTGKTGTAHITATFAGTDVYEAQVLSLDLTVVEHRQSPNLALDPDTKVYTIKSNQTFTHPEVIHPEDLEITWSSSEPTVASVNTTTGVVTVKGVGTTVISASNAENEDYFSDTVSYTLIVEDHHVAPGLSFSNPGPFTIKGGQEFTAPTLNAVEGFDTSKVSWSSDNQAVATVADGVVTLVGGFGTATITASFAGDNTYFADTVSYELTVIDPNGPIKLGVPERNWDNQKELDSYDDDTQSVNFKFEKGSYSSSAKYYTSGEIRFYSGNKLTVTAKNGQCISKIVIHYSSASYALKQSEVTLSPQVTDDYTYTVSGADATWLLPPNTTVATLTNKKSSQGRITEVEVYLSDPLPKLQITVKDEYKNGKNYTLGDTPVNVFEMLNISGQEEGVVIQASNFTYSSSNSDIVEVSNVEGSEGKLTLKSTGEDAVIISATFKGIEGKYQSSDPVQINIIVSSKPHLPIEFKDPLDTTLDLYGTKTLNFFNLLKSELTEEQKDNFQFVSSDKTVATVSQTKGTVSAVATGTAVITATYGGDDTYDETSVNVTITVIDGRSQISLSFTESQYLYLTNDKDPFRYPALNGNDEGLPIVWSSSDTNIAGVNETGKVTLTEVGGTAVITAEFKGTETIQPAKASYTIIVVNPNDPFKFGVQDRDRAEGRPLGGKTFEDISGLVSFTFEQNGGTNPTFGETSGVASLRLYQKNKVTVSVAEGYYISHVSFEPIDQKDHRFTSIPIVPKGTEFLLSISSEQNFAIWDFHDDLTSGTLTLPDGTSAVWLKEISVYIRPVKAPAKLTLKAKDNTVTCLLGNQTTNVAENFTVTGLQEGDSFEDLHIHYTSSDTDVAYITEDGEMMILKTGRTTITALFEGDFRYAPASDSYTLIVSDKDIIPIVFKSDVVTWDLYASEGQTQLKVSDIIDWEQTHLTDEQKKTLEYSSSNPDIVSVNGAGTITIKAGAKDGDEVDITVLLPEEEGGKFASTEESFTIHIIDGRTKVELSFPKTTYSFNVNSGELFESPVLQGADGLETIDWTSSDETVATVDSNGLVTILGKPGEHSVRITASFAGDGSHKPASAFYRLTVTGPAFTVDQYLDSEMFQSVSGQTNISVRGYIVGYYVNGNTFTPGAGGTTNIAIAQFPGETDDKKVVSIQLPSGDIRNAFNLSSNPEKLGRQILVTGKSATYCGDNGINPTSSIILLKDADFEISSYEIAPGATIIISSKDVTDDNDINYVVIGTEIGGTGSKVHFPESTGIGEYTLMASHQSANSTYPASKMFTISVVEGKEVTLRFIHAVNLDWAEYDPHVRIETSTGTLYTEGRENSNQGWMPMEEEGTSHHFGKPYYSHTFRVPESELVSSQSRVIAKSPEYGDETENPDTDTSVVVTPNHNGDFGTSNLHFTFGHPEVHSVESDASPLLMSNAPVGDNMVYAAAEEPVKLYVVAEDGSVLGTLENVGGETPNLWKGEIKDYSSSLADGSYLSFCLATRLDSDGKARTTGTFVGAEEPMSDSSADALSDGIISYMDYVANHPFHSGMTPAEEEEYYAGLNKAAEAGSVSLSVEKISANARAAGVNDIMINLSKLAQGEAGYTVGEPLYIATELDGGSNKNVNMLSLSPYEGDIQVGVNEINSNDDGITMWFNLRGERIPEPSEGIVIRVRGGKAEKLLIIRR